MAPGSADTISEDHVYYIVDTCGVRCFSVNTTLTADDKKLVLATTGWDIDADPRGKTASQAALEFAGRLNMDRYSSQYYGTPNGSGLTGEVTPWYIEEIIHEELSGPKLVPLDTLYKGLNYLNGSGSSSSGS